MKSLTKSSLVAVALALLGVAAASADDQQLTDRLLRQQAQDTGPQRSTTGATATRGTTVAVYANGAAVGNRNVQDTPGDTIYEFRPTGHGQLIGLYRAAQ